MPARPRDDEAAALRPTLLLALIVSVTVAFVVFWPRKNPIEITTPPKAPDPVAANTTASSPIVAPPIEEITDEVIVIVGPPGAMKTATTAPVAIASAPVTATIVDAAAIPAPLALSVGPILSVDHVQPRNNQPDKSEPARVTTKIWDCPWPPKGSASKITQIKVHVKVSVSWEGRPTEVEVLDDPGLDFGEYAKKCALTQTYVPSRDARGQPVNGQTGSFAVMFDRGGR